MPDDNWHRAWLHAIEADWSIRSKALQVARVIADFAVSRGGGRAAVSWRMLRRCTHQGNTTLSRSLSALESAGWLATDERKNGQRAVRQLLIPATAPQAGSAPASGGRPLPHQEGNRSPRGSANYRRPERHTRARAPGEKTAPTPVPPNIRDLCPRCSKTGHTNETCPERVIR